MLCLPQVLCMAAAKTVLRYSTQLDSRTSFLVSKTISYQ